MVKKKKGIKAAVSCKSIGILKEKNKTPVIEQHPLSKVCNNNLHITSKKKKINVEKKKWYILSYKQNDNSEKKKKWQSSFLLNQRSLKS